jgi:hypothetical protein
MERISAIDSQRLNMVAKEILDPERMFALIYS